VQGKRGVNRLKMSADCREAAAQKRPLGVGRAFCGAIRAVFEGGDFLRRFPGGGQGGVGVEGRKGGAVCFAEAAAQAVEKAEGDRVRPDRAELANQTADARILNGLAAQVFPYQCRYVSRPAQAGRDSVNGEQHRCGFLLTRNDCRVVSPQT